MDKQIEDEVRKYTVCAFVSLVALVTGIVSLVSGRGSEFTGNYVVLTLVGAACLVVTWFQLRKAS